MSNGIDYDTKTINLVSLLPNQGDSVMIVNCGDHYEMHESRLSITAEVVLTDDELMRLRAGTITWN